MDVLTQIIVRYSLLLGLISLLFGVSCILISEKYGKKVALIWVLGFSLFVIFGFGKFEMKDEIIEKSDIVESIDLLAQ